MLSAEWQHFTEGTVREVLGQQTRRQTLNDTIDQLDLIDTYRTSHPQTMIFTFFSSAHETFSRINHTLGHKSSLGKFKNIEITSSIFSDYSVERFDVN